MATMEFLSDETSTSIADVRNRARLIQAVLERLDGLARLDALAREIFEGLAAPQFRPPSPNHRIKLDWFQGESDTLNICGRDPSNPPGETVNFQCSKNDFTCGSFVCESATSFNGCGKTDFGCSSTADQYQCKKSYNCKADYYDCHDFSCGDKATTGTFNCDSKVDFICGGPKFNCAENFQCTSGHIFMCGNAHGCTDSFNCRSTGNPDCQNWNNYNRNGDGSDTSPGDFVCGVQGGSTDTFNCANTFQCSAFDEFECTASTSFGCGDGAGGSDSFNCGKASKFQCSTKTAFTCNASATFDCSGQYTPPPY